MYTIRHENDKKKHIDSILMKITFSLHINLDMGLPVIVLL